MADFNFITVPELRQNLESDYAELQTCLANKAWKAVHVLAGSIIEATLIDALYAEKGAEKQKLDKMDFIDLIKACRDKNIITEDSFNLSTVVRQYRNLIHPGKVKRLAKAAGSHGAVVAGQLVEIVTTEVAKRKKETYGFTAEQVLTRLSSGSSALPLVGHLLKDCPEPEIQRLLIDLLPSSYQSLSYGLAYDPSTEAHLRDCYRTVLNAAPEEVRRAVIKAVYNVYRNRDESTVIMYEETFLRCSDLQYLTEDERQFIKAHLLPRIHKGNFMNLYWALNGMGAYLTKDEAVTFVDTLFSVEAPVKANAMLIREYAVMTDKSRLRIREFLKDVESACSGEDVLRERCKTLIARMERTEATKHLK